MVTVFVEMLLVAHFDVSGLFVVIFALHHELYTGRLIINLQHNNSIVLFTDKHLAWHV